MTPSEEQLRVLVIAPTGRDGPLICNLLRSKDILCVNLPTAEMARIQMKAGVGVVILAEEGLTLADIAQWTKELAVQPSWSDLPIILLTVTGAVDHENQRKELYRQPLGNLILLERPVRPETLVSTVQAALRSRRRQYQIRDYLDVWLPALPMKSTTH
jgi:DNA-binding response OmpR family regulator